MALIQCKECGKEISDTVRKCPHCGYANKDLKQDKVNSRKNFIKQHIKVISILVIVLVVGLVVFIAYNKKIEYDRIQAEIQANTLTDDEKMVASIVKKYKSALKNPESMQIFEIRKYDSFVLMDTSGQNGFGGNTRDVVSYSFDGTYMGNDNKADRKITKYTSTEDRLEIVFAQAIKKNWTTRTDYTVIDKDKILRNLEQVY